MPWREGWHLQIAVASTEAWCEGREARGGHCRRFTSMRAPTMFVVQRGIAGNAAALQEVAGRMCLSGTFSG